MEYYDIAIIGLGPAGAFLARHLRDDFKVIAIDRKRPVKEDPDGFHKPCGGLLAPDAQKALSRFQMTLPLRILVNPQIFSVRTIDAKAKLVRHYQRHYINLNRQELDLWLMSLIPSSIDVRRGARVTGVQRHEQGGYTVAFNEGQEERVIRAKAIVGADGANSLVRRTLLKPLKTRTYLCIQQWFEDMHAAPFYSCVFDADSTDCYAWGLTKENMFLFGGAFPVRGGKERFEALKHKLSAFGFHLEAPLRTESCLALRPKGMGSFCCGKEQVYLVGEAAGFISPSSLEGISYAIESGYALSQCLNREHGAMRAYRRATGKLRWKLLLKAVKSPFLYWPFLRGLVMRSGLNSIRVVAEPKD